MARSSFGGSDQLIPIRQTGAEPTARECKVEACYIVPVICSSGLHHDWRSGTTLARRDSMINRIHSETSLLRPRPLSRCSLGFHEKKYKTSRQRFLPRASTFDALQQTFQCQLCPPTPCIEIRSFPHRFRFKMNCEVRVTERSVSKCRFRLHLIHRPLLFQKTWPPWSAVLVGKVGARSFPLY